MNITVKLDPSVLNSASLFFNCSIQTIVKELMQNSRRAKATKLSITHDEDKTIFTDNGVGIDDPQILLTLGQSKWSELSERPAGMGFFCLSNVKSCVASKDWVIFLEPDSFKEGAEVKVYQVEAPREGTVVTIWDLPKGEVHSALRYCCNGYPLELEYEGKIINTTNLPSARNGFYRNWEGLEFRVTKTHNSILNFYGIDIYGLPSITSTNLDHYSVLVRVINCHKLNLTLPARDWIVEDDFYQQLCNEVKRTSYEYIAKYDNQHQLKYLDYLEAKQLGIDLGEATRRLFSLNTFTPIDPDESCLCISGFPYELDVILATLLEETHGTKLLKPQPGYEGYSWYDPIPKYLFKTILIDGSDWEEIYLTKESISHRVDKIEVLLTNEVTKEELILELPALILPDDNVSCHEIYVAKSEECNQDTLIQLLLDSDSSDDAFSNPSLFAEAKERVTSLLYQDKLEARIERLKELITNEISWLCPTNTTITITKGKVGIAVDKRPVLIVYEEYDYELPDSLEYKEKVVIKANSKIKVDTYSIYIDETLIYHSNFYNQAFIIKGAEETINEFLTLIQSFNIPVTKLPSDIIREKSTP